MTPAERAFWQRVNHRASALTPELSAALLRAFDTLRERIGETAVRHLIETGQVETLFRLALSDRNLDVAFAPVRDAIYRQTSSAVTYFARDLPGMGRIDGVVGVTFNVLNPKMLDAVRALATRVLTTLRDDVRAVVRQAVADGLKAGIGPRAMAREIRSAIGLAPNQLRAVANFRAALEAGDVGKALGYQLRDRRFDRTLAKGPLTPAQIEKMVDAYRRRFVAWNADTNARTAALDAQKLGQRLAWDESVAKGIVDGDSLYKRWVGVLDERERPEHLHQEGDTVPFDAPFSNGEMVPGESTYNCRCLARYMVRPNGPPIEGAGDRAARAKAARLLVAAGGDPTVPF